MKLFSSMLISLFWIISTIALGSDDFTGIYGREQVPEQLLRAICTVESNLDYLSYNHQDGGSENSSFGICQVSYKTAVRLGFKDDRCVKDFTQARNTYMEAKSKCKLFDTKTNIHYAALELKHQLDRYKGSWLFAIAAYNAGSALVCKTGKVHRTKDKKIIYTCKIGGLLNQKYIDKVLKTLAEGR